MDITMSNSHEIHVTESYSIRNEQIDHEYRTDMIYVYKDPANPSNIIRVPLYEISIWRSQNCVLVRLLMASKPEEKTWTYRSRSVVFKESDDLEYVKNEIWKKYKSLRYIDGYIQKTQYLSSKILPGISDDRISYKDVNKWLRLHNWCGVVEDERIPIYRPDLIPYRKQVWVGKAILFRTGPEFKSNYYMIIHPLDKEE